MIDGVSNTNATNHIYTDQTSPTDLLIQSKPSPSDFNTIINANNTGHVQIGDVPYANGNPAQEIKLEVRGSISIYDGNGNNDNGDHSLFFGREQTPLNSPASGL